MQHVSECALETFYWLFFVLLHTYILMFFSVLNKPPNRKFDQQMTRCLRSRRRAFWHLRDPQLPITPCSVLIHREVYMSHHTAISPALHNVLADLLHSELRDCPPKKNESISRFSRCQKLKRQSPSGRGIMMMIYVSVGSESGMLQSHKEAESRVWSE